MIDQRNSSGFTLIEALVAIVILGVILVMTSSFLSQGFDSYFRGAASNSLGNDLAGAKTVFLDDLSVAGFRETPTTTFVALDRSTPLATVLTFEGDIDSDNVIERVCYRINANELQRSIEAEGVACGTTAYQTLLTGVTAFTLTFLNADRVALTDAQVVAGTAPGPARYVALQMTADGAYGGRTVTRSIAGQVAIRNS